MKKPLLLAGLLTALLPFSSQADDSPWYRNAGEYLATRSVRMGVPTDFSTMVITDGKRFDVNVGKRIPLYTWGEDGFSKAWSFGVDGGVLASLARYQKDNNLTFATNTFDGFFGAYVGYMNDGWIAMLRTAHLSAHLVDNAPEISTGSGGVSYSQFWNEIIVGKTFPGPTQESPWEIHLQGSLGVNNTSTPRNTNPRAAFGISAAHSLSGHGSFSVLGSADVLRAGVEGQKASYTFFLGVGSMNRVLSTSRPFRVGVAHFTGSDYRNQYYQRRHKWTAFQVAVEF